MGLLALLVMTALVTLLLRAICVVGARSLTLDERVSFATGANVRVALAVDFAMAARPVRAFSVQVIHGAQPSEVLVASILGGDTTSLLDDLAQAGFELAVTRHAR